MTKLTSKLLLPNENIGKLQTKGGGPQKRAVLFEYRNLRTSIQELENNLKEIITQIMTGNTQSDDENEPGTSQGTSEDKQEKRKVLKEKLLSKLSLSKKQQPGPFPGDRIIRQRIWHTFVDSEDGALLECKGTVLRRATEEDIDELRAKPTANSPFSVFFL